MFFEHLTNYQAARLFTAAVLAFLGILEIVAPWCFWGISIYFKGARASLGAQQRERLERVLAARRLAEGDAEPFYRYVGFFTIAMAMLVLVPTVPYVLPYALCCIAIATATLLSYRLFRRATERRVAPLARRSPWQALPPIAMAATAVCLLGSAAFAAYPQFRLGVVIVIASALVLVGIAWRIAVAPAMLLGEDSQLEYLVDERIRVGRATGLLSLACAPPTVLVGLAVATLPASAHFFGAMTFAVSAAFLVALIVSFIPMRKRISLA
jgi:hypothetical protein